MNKNYEYDYEWDSRYCYPKSSVLKNKLGIRDAEQLHIREGNGRVQRLFIQYLTENAGYLVDFSQVNDREMIEASAEAFACNYDKMNALFQRITKQLK